MRLFQDKYLKGIDKAIEIISDEQTTELDGYGKHSTKHRLLIEKHRYVKNKLFKDNFILIKQCKVVFEEDYEDKEFYDLLVSGDIRKSRKAYWLIPYFLKKCKIKMKSYNTTIAIAVFAYIAVMSVLVFILTTIMEAIVKISGN